MALVLGTNCGFVTTAPTSNPSGTADMGVSNRVVALKVTSGGDALSITSIGWWSDVSNAESNYEVGIYDHDSNNDRPKDLLYSVTTNAKGTGAGWKTSTGLSGWNLDASTIYWIAVQVDKATPETKMDTSADTGEQFDWGGATTLTNPWEETSTVSNRIIAVYAVWEEATTGTNTQINIGDAWKEISAAKINIGDTWKEVAGMQVNIGDAWKTVF